MDDKQKYNLKKPLRFAEQLRIALSKPSLYRALFLQKPARHIGYFIILLVFSTVIAYAVPLAAYIQNEGGLRTYCMEVLPQFAFTEEGLQVDDRYKLDFASCRVVIDTSVEAFTREDAQAFAAEMEDRVEAPVVYAISKTTIANNDFADVVRIQDLYLTGYNNAVLYQNAPLYMVIGGVFAFFYQVLSYLARTFVYAGFGFLFSRLVRIRLNFGSIYLVALYARSVQIILETALQAATNLSWIYLIGGFIGAILACNYMISGMLSIVSGGYK